MLNIILGSSILLSLVQKVHAGPAAVACWTGCASGCAATAMAYIPCMLICTSVCVGTCVSNPK